MFLLLIFSFSLEKTHIISGSNSAFCSWMSEYFLGGEGPLDTEVIGLTDNVSGNKDIYFQE